MIWDGRGANRKPVGGGRFVIRVDGDERGRHRVARARPDRPSGQGLASSASTVTAVLVASILSELSDAVTSTIGDYGLYAVFWLMFIDAVFPAASELVMVYGGALACGCVRQPGRHPLRTDDRRRAARVSRDLSRRHDRIHARRDDRLGDWLLRRSSLPRATRSLAPPERGEARPRRAMVRAMGGLGRVSGSAHPGHPILRLVPAGVIEVRFVRYTLLTLLGSAIWCFAFAGDGLPRGGALGGLPRTRFATSRSSSPQRSSVVPAGSRGGTSSGAERVVAEDSSRA